ncbi:MAG: hypothetical protein HY260_22010 [Chloroflexi bacterium]|nr:hypothetical protein [Chloroflexota bacterium]
MSVSTEIQTLVSDIDRMMDELAAMRRRIIALLQQATVSLVPVSEWEAVGMWADREDMRGISTEDWLARLRAQQWGRSSGRLTV